ncbi:hypothetical protein N0V95_000424 [Ascochyta clinopodiicola]|nr:hypothetical protein N0V95_000424 [Ascochyta clinopodiicola]
MRSLTINQWIYKLQTRFSFVGLSESSDPYVKAMHTFQSFTNDIASALLNNNTIGLELIEENMLQSIYNDLPSFYRHEKFRDWVKDATLKHPHRRTPKQYQWLCIVSAQQQRPSKSKADLVHLLLDAQDWPSAWAKGAYDIKSLLKDPEPQWFFRNNNGIKAANRNKDDCVMEPLHGLTPERYWTLREVTRKDRLALTKVLWLLSHDLAPEHRAQVEQDRDDLCTLLESKVETA